MWNKIPIRAYLPVIIFQCKISILKLKPFLNSKKHTGMGYLRQPLYSCSFPDVFSTNLLKFMKTKIFLPLTSLLLAALLFNACQKEAETETVEIQQVTDENKYYTPNLTDFVTDRSGYWTEIPAGSVDALSQAIAEADAGGVIYLKAGMHTETDRVTVNKRIKLIGAEGAILRIQSNDTTSTSNPAIHVVNAPGTAIQNIVIEPYNDGAHTAVLFEKSPQSALLSSKISGFPMAVLIEKSDYFALINNQLIGTKENHGVLVNNGKSVYVGGNDISNFLRGLWACDEWGTAENNTFHGNNNGALLCKYNTIFGFTIPGNPDPISADMTCKAWKLRNNIFVDNLNIGLAIFDGATLNFVANTNQFSEHGIYDIWISGDTDTGVLFLPASSKNTIHTNSTTIIKDCGIDNVINGGTLIDTTLDPC